MLPDRDKRARVLVVDDDIGVRDLLKELLAIEGFEVTITSGVSEGLQLIEDQTFDFLFLDLVFNDDPMGRSGVDVWRMGRAQQPESRAVLMSGTDPDALHRIRRSCQFHAILNKPFSINDVRAVLNELRADSV